MGRLQSIKEAAGMGVIAHFEGKKGRGLGVGAVAGSRT